MPVSHVAFDFFGTLVHYRQGVATEDIEGTLQVLEMLGLTMSSAEFSQSWDAAFAGFETEAEKTLVEYSIDSMLEHAVMHPLRHRFQLEELIAKAQRAG